MKRLFFLFTLGILVGLPQFSSAFCGFYVAKADTRLFNQASEVILTRYGNETWVTMSNDFRGDVSEFAMVVPVPEILERNDIAVVDNYIFDKLETYSGPRLVEYHDNNPCQEMIMYDRMEMSNAKSAAPMGAADMAVEEEYSVTIEAEYTVGEYDILILSAKESEGLKRWLTDNDYTIPESAHEVLDPYIKNNLKFFVVKVNLEEQEKLGFNELRPIRIKYNSRRFMLPIRLGMANADGPQDLIIYAMTPKGRVETTNYRTVEIPTNVNIPTFLRNDFGTFYADLFTKAYERKRKRAVFLEYAWDLSSSQYTKCDPCATTPPTYRELTDAGVHWVDYKPATGWQGADYSGDVFFTRLHVRYDREHFPMDLQFQTTANQATFQGRYVMQNMATGPLDCPEAKTYLEEVLTRRENELDQLEYLAGWDVSEYEFYVNQIDRRLDRMQRRTKDYDSERNTLPIIPLPKGPWPTLLLLAFSLCFIGVVLWRGRQALA